MNTPFLKVTALIFVFLFVLAVAPWIGDLFRKEADNKNFGENVSVNLASFTENSVDRIAIQQKGKNEITLEQQGSDWKRGPDTADKDKVSTLFQAFANLSIVEMASKNEENFSKLGVTKEDGIQLTLREKSGQEQIFYIGNSADVPQEFFIRKDAVKNAYSVQGSLRGLLAEDASYWKPSPPSAPSSANSSGSPSVSPTSQGKGSSPSK